jgi:hypothetical protein
MTFEQANRWAKDDSYSKNDKAEEAFGIKYYSSICKSCDNYHKCFYADSYLIKQCNFFQSGIKKEK